MKKSELKQIIKEEISNVLGEGKKPGPKEQKRRETYQIAGKYLSDNPEYKSFSYDEDTDEFHFYTTDWSVSSSTPSETISRELLSGKTLNEEDPLQTAFNKKVGMPEPSGVKNTLRPKSIEIEFSPNLKIQKILIDGTTNTEKGKDLIKQYTGLDASWNNTKSIAEKLRDKKINFSYSEVDRT
jgi:hypothetical protein